ncbi:MAG: Uma2 family endonuclease [Chloroflexota bacterium]
MMQTLVLDKEATIDESILTEVLSTDNGHNNGALIYQVSDAGGPPKDIGVYHGQNGVYIEYDENNQPVIYPESDGQRMAENNEQFFQMSRLEGNFQIMTADEPNIFVVGDLLWYPVQGKNRKGDSFAPDIMIIIGRPKGYRGSYLQWKENDIAPQIVFEIWSPANNEKHKREKFNFYQKHGVEEYYTYAPDKNLWEGWIRDQDVLEKIEHMDGWRSPRLGFQFKRDKNNDIDICYPDGRSFWHYIDFNKLRQADAKLFAEQKLLLTKAAQERIKADRRAREEARRANEEAQERIEAERRAEEESRRAEEESRRAKEESRRAEEESRRAEEEARRAEEEARHAEEESRRAEGEAQARIEAERRAEEATAQLLQLQEQLRLMQEQDKNQSE